MQNNNFQNPQQLYGPLSNDAAQGAPHSGEAPVVEENFLEFQPDKKSHPVLKTTGLIVAMVGLFCMSTLAGMMSDGKRPYMALFKNTAQHTEVKGVSVTVPSSQSGSSGLVVGSASEVGQASGTNDNNATLTPSSPFYQYVDTFGSDQITVARQPLPDDFNGNPAGLGSLASRIGANQSFSTDKWGTAYMMTSGEVQVVTVANNNYMVFLRSTQPHTKEDWKRYIETFTLR